MTDAMKNSQTAKAETKAPLFYPRAKAESTQEWNAARENGKLVRSYEVQRARAARAIKVADKELAKLQQENGRIPHGRMPGSVDLKSEFLKLVSVAELGRQAALLDLQAAEEISADLQRIAAWTPGTKAAAQYSRAGVTFSSLDAISAHDEAVVHVSTLAVSAQKLRSQAAEIRNAAMQGLQDLIADTGAAVWGILQKPTEKDLDRKQLEFLFTLVNERHGTSFTPDTMMPR